MSEKYLWFDKIKFTRDDKTGYYLNSTIRKRMHRYVWEHYNGEIPKGCHVHHIDHDRGNNNINNLQLITASKHESEHSKEKVKNNYNEIIENLNTNARPKAFEWHKSKKGLEWHKKHYEQMKEKLFIKAKYTCEYCGKEFETTKGNNKFCSNKCKSAWRRKEGLDNEKRICEYCGREFETNKYSKTRTCSRSCANKLVPRLPQLRKNKKY